MFFVLLGLGCFCFSLGKQVASNVRRLDAAARPVQAFIDPICNGNPDGARKTMSAEYQARAPREGFRKTYGQIVSKIGPFKPLTHRGAETVKTLDDGSIRFGREVMGPQGKAKLYLAVSPTQGGWAIVHFSYKIIETHSGLPVEPKHVAMVPSSCYG